MRISADPSDMGFHPQASRFLVTLNGKPVPHARTADEELGLVHVWQENAPDRTLAGDVKIERLH
jgi:hypothetical protein